jgi:hypothetical protein
MEANPNVEIKAGGGAPSIAPAKKGPINFVTAEKMVEQKPNFPFDGETHYFIPVQSASGNPSEEVIVRLYMVIKNAFSYLYY